MRKAASLVATGALLASGLTVATAVGVPSAASAAEPAVTTGSSAKALGGSSIRANAPGNPGAPSAPTVVFQEDFENVAGTAPVLLNQYQSVDGYTYTAATPWLTNCNGVIVNYGVPYTSLGNCVSPTSSGNLRQLAWVLGQHIGAADPATNDAVAAFTEGDPGANQTEFQTVNPIPVANASGRFLTFSVDAAAKNCAVSAPSYQFSFVSEAGVATPVGGQVNACATGETVRGPAVGSVTSEAWVNVGTYTSNGSVLFDGASLGIRMANGNGSGVGNDAAFDNIRILDVTPQLDKTFSPTAVPLGATSTLTMTITNTSELAAKNGWAFTDELPEGLVVAPTPSIGGTCVADVTADAGAEAIAVANGTLAAGAASCTITVDVTSDTVGEYTNGAGNITGEVGVDLPGDSTVEFYPEDFGDAPASYGTTAGGDGARHGVRDFDADAETAAVMLGGSVNAETDGQPSEAADADSDDGVTFNPDLGYAAPTLRTGTDSDSLDAVENTVRVDASANGFASVWVDWNQDGDFADDGEQVVASAAVTAGENDLTFAQGDNPAGIQTFVRVRYSTDAEAIATPTGAAPDGEVEDYQVLVERLLQPDTCYSTDTEYYALTFADRVSATGAGQVGSASRYANVTVVNGIAVDAVIELVGGALNAASKTPNGIGTGTGEIFEADDAQWQIDRNATMRYSFFEAGTNTPVQLNGVFTVNDMDGTPPEQAVFTAADLARYAVSASSTVTVSENGSDVVFTGSGDNDGDSKSRFQIVLEGVDSFEASWQGGANSGFGFDGDGDIGVQPPACDDFGDAPDSYGTTTTADGASHRVTPGIHLGAEIDFDPDGQPGTDANGDDLNRLADEDGVVFNPDLGYDEPTLRTGTDPNSLGAVENTLQVEASADGFVSVWVDWNQDGDFADDGEQVVAAEAVVAGQNDLVFEQGENPAGIRTYVRVRYSTDAESIATPTGPAADGEVEDYRVLLERLVRPDTCTVSDVEHYSFSFAGMTDQLGTGGPGSSTRFTDVTVIDGTPVDVVATLVSGQLHGTSLAPPNGFGATPTQALRWQLLTSDAEVRFEFFIAGTTTPIAVNGVFTAADLDGIEGNPAETVTFDADDLAGYAVTEGSSVLITETEDEVTFTGVGDWDDQPESRFQFVLEDRESFTVTSQGPSGGAFAFSGDGSLSIEPPACSDFGDAPDSYGTTIDADGAEHQITPGLTLGTEIDFDPDGQPSDDAAADEDNRIMDEDGVADPIVVTTGAPTTVTVTVTNDTAEPATLAGWIDLNGDGDFDSEERVVVTVPADSGTATYDLPFPAGEPEADTFARFRLFGGEVADPAPTGAADAGEVEDYPVTVLDRGLEIDKESSATADTRVGDTVTYTVTATNTGEGDYTADSPARVSDDLSGVLDDADYNQDAEATIDGETVAAPVFTDGLLSWTGALASGETVEITYTVTLTAGGDGVVRNLAFELDCDPSDPECDPPTECDEDDPSCTGTEFDLPRLTVEKTADRTELPLAGDTVQYTITVTNVGPGDYTTDAPASFTDDMSDVLDDATYNDDAAASIGEVVFDEPELSWEGVLVAGQSATVTYTVEYTAEGDLNVENTVCVPDTEVPPGVPACDPVSIDGAHLDAWKQITTEDDPLIAGSVLTYTLFFKASGSIPATVDYIDDLTHVLDDADVTTEPGSEELDAVRDGSRIHVTGAVEPGQTYTVAYQVTLREDAERGDDILGNFLIPIVPGNEVPPPPPAPECEPTDAQLPDCTETPVGRLRTGKAVKADSDPIEAGTTLTFTLTFRNDGKATVPVDRVDRLADVLDDATLADLPVASDDALSVSELTEDETFLITGSLEPGQVETVVYSVTVNPEHQRGDNEATNLLVRPGEIECEPAEDELSNCTNTPLPEIVHTKSSDPETGTELLAGEEVTYTLTFTNVGKAAGRVNHVDDLEAVLDDADVTVAPHASDDALSVTDGENGQIDITGTLQPGQSVTVEYTVAVRPDGQRGDNELRNVLSKPGGGDCEDAGVSCTEHPVGELDDWKTVDPAFGSTVQAGRVVTYTLHFENTGKAPVPVDREDDLAAVLDDATITAEPVSSDEALTVSEVAEDRFGISGSLRPGQLVTVTYAVTVNEDGARGDDLLANFLLDPGDVGGKCEPEDGERPDCTLTHVSDLVPSKSADPERGSTVAEGQEVTYTLTFRNVSKDPDAGPAPLDYTDHMADVLDDATLTAEPASSMDSVTAVSDGDTIRVTGYVPTGETATVTYTVTTDSWAEQGDHHLGNVVAETGEDPVCVPDSPLCTDHVLERNPPLAITGGDVAWSAVGAALVLLVGGGVLLMVRRRRQAVRITERDELS